jgi:hypothetical protein
MGKPSVKALRKRLSGKVADHPGVTAWWLESIAECGRFCGLN